MAGRIILQCCVLLPLLLAGAGCNREKAKPAQAVVVNAVRPSEIARNDLYHVARKIEDPASFQQLQFYISSFEDPSKGWTWPDLNEYVHNGNYSIQTRHAYDNYRRIKTQEMKR